MGRSLGYLRGSVGRSTVATMFRPAPVPWSDVRDLARWLLCGCLVVACSSAEAPASPTPRVAPSSQTPSSPDPGCTASVQVGLSYPGASPAEVEQSLVLVAEQDLRSIDGVQGIDATSTEGHANLIIRFQPDDLPQVLDEVRTVLTGITAFPKQAERPSVSLTSAESSRVFVVTGGRREDLRSVTEPLERALQRSTEVGGVWRRGGTDPVVSVVPDLARVHAWELQPHTFAELVGRELSALAPSTAIDTIEQLQSIRLSPPGFPLLTVADVATITVGPDPVGPQAWTAGTDALVLIAQANDTGVVRATVEQAKADLPPSFPTAVLGRLEPRRCPRWGGPPEFDGDLTIIEFDVASAARTSMMSAVRRGPVAQDAVWLLADSPLAGPGSLDRQGLWLLLPAGSPDTQRLVQWAEQTPELQMRGHYGPDRGHAIIELRHVDHEPARRIAAEFVDTARAQGLRATTQVQDEPQIDIALRPSAAALGITASDIATAVRAVASGRTLGFIERRGRSLPVRVVWSDPSQPTEDPLTQLSELRLPSTSGFIPLSEVAQVSLTASAHVLRRRDGRPVQYVHVWFEQAQRTTVTTTIDEQLLPALVQAHPGLDARRL